MIANADPQELAKFGDLAHRWWDINSEFKPLHDINPLRLDWINRSCTLQGKKVIDIGCGGGILAEGMAALGADVTGIDLGEKALGIARLHLLESGLKVDYRHIAAEDMAQVAPASCDIVTCLEMLEHVPDPASIVSACAQLVKPGGTIFFSTISRNPKAWLFAVIGAEYLLKLLPRGTHAYTRFIRPAELSRMCRAARLSVKEIIGMNYNPMTKRYALGLDASVNYLMRACRDA
jgi:2-polyprenyl-6-hydroxyphenyl methylase/3-demethylubiquinone-9 3-methyltransferase